MMFTDLQLHDIWQAELKRVGDNRRRGPTSMANPSVFDPTARGKAIPNKTTTPIRTPGVGPQPRPVLQEVARKPNLDGDEKVKSVIASLFTNPDENLDDLISDL